MDFGDDVLGGRRQRETGEGVQFDVGGGGIVVVLGTRPLQVVVDPPRDARRGLRVEEVEPRVRQADHARGDAVGAHERTLLVKGRVRLVHGPAPGVLRPRGVVVRRQDDESRVRIGLGRLVDVWHRRTRGEEADIGRRVHVGVDVDDWKGGGGRHDGRR